MSPAEYSEDFFKGPACALVIGISEYKHGRPLGDAALQPLQFRNLKFAAKDARDFADFLKRNGVIPSCVHELFNEEATLRNIKTEFDKLRRECKAVSIKPMVFMYFSGHGMVDGDNQHFLMPYDGEADELAGTALSNDAFQDYLKKLDTDRLVIFLDACHSGGMSRQPGAKGSYAYLPPADLGAGTGRCVIASCKPNQLSWEGEDNGIFTGELLDLLNNGSDEIQDPDINVFNLCAVLTKRVKMTALKLKKPEQELDVDMNQASGLVLAVNRYQSKVIREKNNTKRQYVELIWRELEKTPRRDMLAEKLRNYVDGKMVPWHEQFYGVFNDYFGECNGQPSKSQLDEVCESLKSAHNRALESASRKGTTASEAQTTSTPRAQDQFGDSAKQAISTPDRSAQPGTSISAPQDQERRQFTTEDQDYILENIITELDFWKATTILREGLSRPICKPDLSKLIQSGIQATDEKSRSRMDPFVAEVIQRFQEQWPNAAVVKSQTVSSVMIDQKSR